MRQHRNSSSNPPAWPSLLRKYALTVAICALSGGLSAAAQPACAIGRLADVEIVDRADGRALPVYAKDGRHWVVGTPGREYSIRIRNSGGARVLAVTSVDGINVVTGETASPAQSGYVLDGHGNVEIEGWRKSLAQTASFYFTELPDAYAARTGRPENVGVIGVALFRERPQPIARSDRVGKLAAETTRDAASPAPVAAPDAQAGGSAASKRGESFADERARGAAQPGAPLGTGHGRSETSRAEVVRFERETAFPAETITIRYDRRENLVAMGVLPPPVVVRAPDAFPAWAPGFVADPPRR
jgi:hypothetical protein